MALTPAQKYRRELAAKLNAQQQQAAGGDPYGSPQGSEYELMLAQLAEHRRALSDTKGNDAKAIYKVKALEDFDGWVNGVLAAGQGGADPLFMEMFTWNMDVGNYERALAMAQYAVTHNLSMPDQFQRAVPEFLMDMFHDAYFNNKLGENAAELMRQVIDLTSPIDTHDQPRAKLYKAYAFALLGCRPDSALFKDIALDPQKGETALTVLKRAYELNDKVGVKKDIEKLEAALKALEKSNK